MKMSFSSSALSGVPPLRLLLTRVRQRRSAGVFLGNEGIERAGLAPSSSPEAENSRSKTGICSGRVTTLARGVVDVVVAEDVDCGQSIDEERI